MQRQCVEVAAHRCDPLNKYAEQRYGFSLFSLHAACGYLMVFTDTALDNHYPDSGWLYNMSTKTWCDLPEYRYWILFLRELELPYILRNAGKGSSVRPALLQVAGSTQVPYLVDPNTGVSMAESKDIIAYLFSTYGAVAA